MIFTFVSYKGGVGRTRTLVHTGLRLAAQVRELELRVLLIDMDLDAPGFEPYFPEVDLGAAGGVAALLCEYETVSPGERRDWLQDQLAPPAPDPSSRLIFTFEEAANLAVMPAGRAFLAAGGYHRYLEAMRAELDRGSGKLPATDGFFGDFRGALREHWDYVLIDARAGLAEVTFASAIALADVLVACLRLNQANIDGIRDIFGTFLARGPEEDARERRFHVVPVATPVPNRSGKDVVEWIEKATRTFYPETSSGDGEAPADPLGGIFPRLHRIYEDAAARLGEWRFLELDGDPAEGVDNEMPSYQGADQLALHLRTLNADHDVGGAMVVERHLYNEVGEQENALTYWRKRARLQPLARNTWSSFGKGYANANVPSLRSAAREALGSLIEHWREQGAAGSSEQWAPVLAMALSRDCQYFGPERPDSGLATIDEAIELGFKDPDFLMKAESLAGQVVMELADKRQRSEELVDRQGRVVNLKLARTHFKAAARIAESLKSQGKGPYNFNQYDHLAGALIKSGRETKAIRVLDIRLANLLDLDDEKYKASIANVLRSQATWLNHVGHYDWELRDLLSARTQKNDLGILLDLHSAATNCGQHLLARETFERMIELYPGAADAYYREATRLILQAEIGRALELIRMSRQLYRGGSWFHRAEGGAHLMAEDLEEARVAFEEAASGNPAFFDKGLALISSALGNGPAPDSSSFLAGDPGQDAEYRIMAAFAHGDGEALRALYERERTSNRNPKVRAFGLWIRSMDLAVRGLPEAGAALEAVEKLYADVPLLAVLHQNDFELRVLEKVWDHRKISGREELVRPVDELIERLHQVAPPPPESLTPRDVTQPLPSLALVPDSWEP